MSFVDIVFKKDTKSFYDFEIENGDISKTSSFDSAINITIFNERRATAGEVSIPEKRRGWWGNRFLGFDAYEMGSKLWMLTQSRADQNALNDSVNFLRQAFQWFIDDDFLSSVKITSKYNEIGALEITIDLIRANEVVFSRGYQIWQNTITELSN